MKKTNANLTKINIKVVDFEIPSNKAEKLPENEGKYDVYLKKIKKLGAKNVEIREDITLYSKHQERLIIIKELMIQMLIKWKEIYEISTLLRNVKEKILEDRVNEKETYLEHERFLKYIEKDEEYFNSWKPKKGIKEELAEMIIESYEVYELIEGIADWTWINAISEYWWNP
jgi:hypothetical protein